MSRLGDLLDRARGLLSRPRNITDATEAVRQDDFDRSLFNELLDEAPALRAKVEALEQDVDYAGDVIRDTLMQFWKGDPQVRPRTEMAEERLVQHAVATDVHGSDELADARRYTQHDKYGAAMATVGVSERVHDYARKHKKELQEAQERKEEAEKREQEAAQQLQQAADGVPQPGEGGAALPGEDGFHGPLTPEQEAALDALEQAIADLGQAQQANEQASTELQQQAQHAQAALARPISEATSEAKEKLEEEAELFAGWGVSDGQLQEMSFEERAKLAASLRENKMSKFMELVGRFKLMAAAQRVKKVEYGRDQVVGVELSNDLSRVVMAEFANLAMGDDELAEMLELDFYRRLAEGQLLSREFIGTEKVGKGAIICLLDNSGSMSVQHQGVTREAWGKAMALAMLDTAKRQGRQFVGINFSSRSQVSVHRFEPGRFQIADVLAYASEFFGGGTDFETPLDRATDILAEEFNDKGKEKGDLVLITDGECGVRPDWMGQHLKQKERLGFRTFGISIGSPVVGAGTLEALSDNTRSITEFVDPDAVRDIFQVI
jgi:uncharacterized protein with von Willebrand factor type A (vWA) domain